MSAQHCYRLLRKPEPLALTLLTALTALLSSLLLALVLVEPALAAGDANAELRERALAQAEAAQLRAIAQVASAQRATPSWPQRLAEARAAAPPLPPRPR
ncbi:hypothetical protein [Roseateles violae]|uniref:Uncharacterized protein n=1 Tax=Roseateles violae TaxID=3058042 RepID=A0ABT8DZW6_9BURK|nr:hypothetical protein [Pelomonas sp. PFR6]MDN3923152.1 hypothetical protein [Pelomonas sp. PFR6]